MIENILLVSAFVVSALLSILFSLRTFKSCKLNKCSFNYSVFMAFTHFIIFFTLLILLSVISDFLIFGFSKDMLS